MSSAEDIENALLVLWKGKTGASVQAIQRQVALMGLGYVIDRARSKSSVDQPTGDEIAAACRDCISEACGRWSNISAGPDIARDLIGVTNGSVGRERRVRRDRVIRLFGVSRDWLVHKRKDSPADTSSASNETRAIRVTAEAMADSERLYREGIKRGNRYISLEHVDFIVPSVNGGFRCLGYKADIGIGLGVNTVLLNRQLHLVSLRDGAQVCQFHDGWGSADTSFSCDYSGPPGLALGYIDRYEMKSSVLPLDLRREFSNGEELELRLHNIYNLEHARWGEVCDYSFGFFVNPDDVAVPCSLVVQLPDATKVNVRTATHRGSIDVKEEEHLSGDSLRLHKADVRPGTSYTAHWQMTPEKTKLRTSNPRSDC
jgi:hypothetical protein